MLCKRQLHVLAVIDNSLRDMFAIFLSFLLSETGGICITPRPSEDGAEIIPGMPMRPFLGIEPALLDYKQVSVYTLRGENVVCWDCILLFQNTKALYLKARFSLYTSFVMLT